MFNSAPLQLSVTVSRGSEQNTKKDDERPEPTLVSLMALASVVISTSVKISPLSAWMAVRYTSLVFSIPVRAASA